MALSSYKERASHNMAWKLKITSTVRIKMFIHLPRDNRSAKISPWYINNIKTMAARMIMSPLFLRPPITIKKSARYALYCPYTIFHRALYYHSFTTLWWYSLHKTMKLWLFFRGARKMINCPDVAGPPEKEQYHNKL